MEYQGAYGRCTILEVYKGGYTKNYRVIIKYTSKELMGISLLKRKILFLSGCNSKTLISFFD